MSNLQVALFSASLALATQAPGSAGGEVPPQAAQVVARYVAIDNVCAWPNLTRLGDGTVIATIFNQPSHGRAEGDVDCWVTADGRFWRKRGTAAPHDESANRMNVAAGRAADGALVVLASGWSLSKDPQGNVASLVDVLPPWICRSADGAAWNIDKRSFPGPAEGRTPYIPFGDIQPGGDGALRVACYARDLKTKQDAVWIFRSADDGKSWSRQALLSDAHNETAILHLGRGRWLAAARSLGRGRQRLDLLASDDDGHSWTPAGPVSGAMQHPGHLARLKDGRVLLTFGNRIAGQFGVLARWSADEGRTWSEPVPLVDDLAGGDCGYPASVQLRSGVVLTAYYSNGVAAHRRYHMGVVLWNPPPPGGAPPKPSDEGARP